MNEKILSIHVNVDACNEVRGKIQSVNMVSFHGTAQSPFFTGNVLEGGVDTQLQRAEGDWRLSARYMLEGIDIAGEKCRIFVENDGTQRNGETVTKPKLITDSRVLSWLETAELEGHISDGKDGICVDIYEKAMEFERKEYCFSKDGRCVYGELYRPDNGREKCPFVVMAHGYNGCCEHMRKEAEGLAKRGIGVYCFDFCGGGNDSKSSGSTTEMSIPSEQRDLKEVIEEIRRLPWLDREQLYLYGASQGGFVTALTAPEVSDKIQGIFLEFPAFCIPDDWAERRKSNTEELIEFNGMTLGKCFVTELPDYDVWKQASKYTGPVYLFHGDADSVVALKYSMRLEREYRNAELFVYPKQGHGFAEKFLTVMAGKTASVIKQSF